MISKFERTVAGVVLILLVFSLLSLVVCEQTNYQSDNKSHIMRTR